MDLTTLSNHELISEIKGLRGTEREVTVKIIYHLMEIERRGLVLSLGYSGLFDYCMRGLGYSEGSTCRRLSAMTAFTTNPELSALYLDGKLSLAAISAAQVALRDKVAKVEDISGKSFNEIKALVAPVVESRPKEVIKPVIVKSSAPLFNDTPKEERYEIRFSISKETFQKLSQAKDKLSNSLKRDLSVEALVSKLIDNYLSPKERAVAALSSKIRYIPRALRRAVYKRDNGRCSFVSPTGQCCTESRYLHIDHILPFAKGGKTEISNLRLLCSAHNKLCAERHFGREYIKHKINS